MTFIETYLDAFLGFMLFFFSTRMAMDDYRFRTVRLIDVVCFLALILVISQPGFLDITLVFVLPIVIYLIQMALGKYFLAPSDSLVLTFSCLLIDTQHIPFFFIILGGSLIVFHSIMQTARAPFITLTILCFGIVLGLQNFVW